MIRSETKIRVRYGETDQMGYAYYGIYAQYYEVGRVETMRMIGLSYKEVEERGILMPVIDFSITYRKPAYYDDELTITTMISQMPHGPRLPFEYECFNPAGELINSGKVTLVCVDKSSNRMCRIPPWFEAAMAPYFT
jgi:acyl-CoA thioester hydrolase